MPKIVDPIEMSARIKGWGADLDPKNRPAVPKEKAPPEGTGAHWYEPVRQVARFRIHKSPDHKTLTPVFGTSCPPHGISGILRNIAYRYSEGRLLRWMLLLFADRVDVLESSIIDAFKGHPDNPITEMGLVSEIKRHGLRSRVGQHRSDVKSRLPKNLILLAGVTALAWPVVRSFRKAA